MLVIGKPDCQGCKLTTKMLDQFGIEYTYSDVEKSEDSMSLAKRLGYTSLPIIFLSEDEHWSGFRPDLLRALK